MADSKASGFSKVVQKHSLRAKERFLQNFGKKDRTTDELFEIYQNNFAKQQASAMRLQKELKNYATCAREMQAASKSLMECVADIYEHDWPGQDQLPHKAQSLELLWGDLCHKINDQCTIPLSTYLSQFSEIRNKIDKRGRKLLDYDGSRHNLETVQAASKKRDDLKVTKAREQMEESRRLYEVLNKELHEELPALYDSRIPFFVNTFQTMFSSEATFHAEYAKVYAQFTELIEVLAAEAAKGTYQTDVNRYLAGNQSPYVLKGAVHLDEDGQPISGGVYGDGSNSPLSSPPNNSSTQLNASSISYNSNAGDNDGGEEHLPGGGGGAGNGEAGDGSGHQHNRQSSGSNTAVITTNGDGNNSNSAAAGAGDANHKNASEKKSDELYEIPVGATTKDLPQGVLYKVKATYKYAAEDNDELSFESGEIIDVVQYEDPEEQEEGWLMGIREISGEKGLFPANFTRPI
ncbi:PREDICTED: myc box-dependent-interacting protein 1-like [Rhagoletis zephyria]|uniref:myc box-dependent-interacting protein 1-like n=1 Tax=Rhagoletis zephyria TaxID=28612 RepID=UPI00081165D7|nr:PREDICTED: myc box-dependent-interacting protein 1-like [Rhagoletis zephyria]KAH9389067.1 Histone deacetylase complex subunit SAP18 [Tyrophagus putrescentiae]